VGWWCRAALSRALEVIDVPSMPVIEEFLAQHRIAVVGVSSQKSHFGSTVVKELTARGYDVVPVGRSVSEVEGVAVVPTLADLPAPVDGAIVMVGASAAPGVVDEAAAAGITRIWLFKGAGTGAISDEAVRRAILHGMTLVDGACPLMFLEPVGWFHRAHRGIRRMRRQLTPA
jgi:predicted CoA-binding protein